MGKRSTPMTPDCVRVCPEILDPKLAYGGGGPVPWVCSKTLSLHLSQDVRVHPTRSCARILDPTVVLPERVRDMSHLLSLVTFGTQVDVSLSFQWTCRPVRSHEDLRGGVPPEEKEGLTSSLWALFTN